MNPQCVFAADQLSNQKKDAVEWIDMNRAQFQAAADFIFEHPETALREYRSAAYLADMLEKGKFTVERGVAGMPTAFTASYGEGFPVIGILAEYDALPGLSQKAGAARQDAVVPGGEGHGCGHNLFGAASAAAADVSWIAPTSGELRVVTTAKDIPWHSWAMTSCSASSMGRKGMITAAKILAASGIDLLMDTGIIARGKKRVRRKYQRPHLQECDSSRAETTASC